LMFSGPNDYSTYYNHSAPWLSSSGLTSIEKHFSYLSFYDEVIPYQRQYHNLIALGMLENDDTTFVDQILPPFFSSHCLYTRQEIGTADLYHNTTTMNSPINQNAWEYMLISLLDTTSSNIFENKYKNKFDIYPNPSNGIFFIDIRNIHLSPVSSAYIVIYNVQGRQIYKRKMNSNAIEIQLNNQPGGVYFLRLVNDEVIITEKIIIKK
ncbi:MAG: T9SS type A sorting domain-containing protein, partial [Bacteroidales bacterium]